MQNVMTFGDGAFLCTKDNSRAEIFFALIVNASISAFLITTEDEATVLLPEATGKDARLDFFATK